MKFQELNWALCRILPLSRSKLEAAVSCKFACCSATARMQRPKDARAAGRHAAEAQMLQGSQEPMGPRTYLGMPTCSDVPTWAEREREHQRERDGDSPARGSQGRSMFKKERERYSYKAGSILPILYLIPHHPHPQQTSRHYSVTILGGCVGKHILCNGSWFSFYT